MSESSPSGPREEQVSQAVDEFFHLQDLGQFPDVREFSQRYPGVEDELVRLLPALAVFRNTLGIPSAAPQASSQSNNELGDYQLLQEIGRGGMGTVYLAKQISADRQVALKVLNGSLGDGSDCYERFRIEAQILARWKHDKIFQVYEGGKAGECAFVSM